MKSPGEYIIPFLGLANGEHPYQFDIGDPFFKHFETSKVQEGTFEVNVLYDKKDRMVVLSIDIKGHYMADCDRCMEYIQVPLVIEDQVILKLAEIGQSSDDNVYYLDPSTSHIDIAPYIYEAIHLHLPIVNYHASEEADLHHCDPVIIDKMYPQDIEQDKDTEGRDPWSELRKLNLE